MHDDENTRQASGPHEELPPGVFPPMPGYTTADLLAVANAPVEALLEERQKRVAKYHIRPLTQEERETFAAKWRKTQEHFVDDPRDAVAQADALITEAMSTRGYPMADFDQRAADLSVDHPVVCENYRLAHDIAMRNSEGSASTEELRKAMQHYRNLFEHVLDTRVLQYH